MGVSLQHPSAVRNGIWSEGEDGLHILRVALACSILLHSLVFHDAWPHSRKFFSGRLEET